MSAATQTRTTARGAAKGVPPPRGRRAAKAATPAVGSGPRDYVKVAIQYAKSATDPRTEHKFGRWMKLACARFLTDLERAKGKNAPFRFDPEQAANPCDFIEKLPHIEGKWDTPNIKLHDSDIFFLVNLFGFRHENGTRRFTSALKAIARKNAKSTIAAGIGLYCETCEGENGPQVLSAATTGSQARIVFNIANAMVKRTAKLREAFQLLSFANAISCEENAGTFKPINSKASTQDGLNPSCTILDEIHAHKSHDLINVLLSAAGARDSPLFLYTTTEGYENIGGPWAELRHFAKQVLQGIVEADHFFVVIFALDDKDETAGIPGDDDFDERAWVKANPLMEVNPLILKEMRKLAIDAKSMPGRLSEFRIKRLNRPASAAGAWVNLVKWKACRGETDLEWLRQFPCRGGLDLASTSDLTSFRLTWEVQGKFYTHGWRFVPQAAVDYRESRGLVRYGLWVEQGHLLVAGDDVTDYDAVEAAILAAMGRFQIENINYDPWNAKQLTAKLIAKGVKMTEFVQGPKSYHPAMQGLERAYIAGNLILGDDPVLNWNASNMVVRNDANMNMAPDKRKAPDKIDDMVALLMSWPVTDVEAEEDPTEFLRNPIIIA